MLTRKGRVLILIAWLALWLVGLGYFGYSRHQAQMARQREEIAATAKAAAEKEKLAAAEVARLQERLKEQAKRVASLEKTKGFSGTVTIDEADSGISGLVGPRPLADQPIPPVIPAAEKFIADHTLTATSIDTTPYGVINQQRYRVGEVVTLGPGLWMLVAVIKDGYVIFAAGDLRFKMHMVRPK